MSSLRKAAELLARAHSLRDLRPITALLAFGEPAPLDAPGRRSIGLGHGISRAQVARGAGSLRALLVEVAPEAALREAVACSATDLALRSPELLWLVVAVQPAACAVAVAAPPPGVRSRVSALVVDTRRITDSDGETIAAMADAAGAGDLLVHHRWRELLGRDALTRRFYHELERGVFDLASSARGEAPERVRREIALLHASRLLFLAFLEAKGWLDGDRGFLRRSFDARCARGGDVHSRLLEPLFFGTLNTPVGRRATAARALGRIPFLNGGLFARTPVEQRWRALRFTDDALGALIGGLLARYRVTAHENSSAWTEAAVDPEMLGRAFESLMASDDRRASGAFYTPSAIIERVASEGLEEALAALGVPAAVVRAAHDLNGAGDIGALAPAEQARLAAALSQLRVLDPACGSGSFLVHMLERLAILAGAAGDDRPVGARRRQVLATSIFGVDVNPTAVWLCELRLWLSVLIDADERDPLAVAPLPNLDRHIRLGDALAGAAFDDSAGSVMATACAPSALARLRGRYVRATGVRKRSLAIALDREERRAAVAATERDLGRLAARRLDILLWLRSRDLFAERPPAAAPQQRELDGLRERAREARRRLLALRSGAPLPFSFPAHFADVAARGGFDLVIGNPPWVRLHHIPAASREALRARYRAFREAAWASGAALTGAGRAFAGQVDLASLFAERSLSLARPRGAVALLLPAKLWSSLAGGGVRQVIADDADVRRIEDWSESPAAFDAVVYPSLLVAVRGKQSPPRPLSVAVHRRDSGLAWAVSRDRLPLDDSPGAPWLLLPPEARAGFDRLARGGVPLAQSRFGRPLLGVKTGYNEAFVLPRATAPVEPFLLRPLLRGESMRAWRAEPGDEAILWTHDESGAPMAALPRRAAAWLAPWRRRLVDRTDAHSRARWWGLFRTESARCDCPRVVWADIGRAPRALVLPAGDPTVPLNSCYVVRAPSVDDAGALAALLNSPVAAAWLAAIAEPARGGYHRYLGWTMARFPLPADWDRAVALLAPLARAAAAGAPPDPETLTKAVIRAYRVRFIDVAPLLTWCLR